VPVGRIILLVLDVADVPRSLAFYRDLLGIPLRHELDHGGADRWISGDHAAHS
jgi:catechol 2,3-dioxygenase-like lactoylglutathione lyase family enzyme